MSPFSRSRAVARFFLPAVLFALFSDGAHAHVKWFSEPTAAVSDAGFTHSEIIAALLLLLILLAVARWLNAQVAKRGAAYCAPWFHDTKPLGYAFLLLSIYFLGCAFSGFILAPHIAATKGVTALCIGLQATVSILLLLNRAQVFMAGLISSLFVVASVADVTFLLEYVLLLGLAWLVYSTQRIPNEPTMMILRSALGISLVGLALTEKLLQPELAMNVLQQYPLNFMAHLGVPFSDKWFVLAAGMVELLIGLLLMLGWLVRTTILVLLALMIASNSYFVMVENHELALMEFIGHLPVFAAGILLLCYSSTVTRNARELALQSRSAITTEQRLSAESGH